MKPSGTGLFKVPKASTKSDSAMKFITTFLVLYLSLLSNYGDTFFVDSVVKPVAQPVAALAPAVEAVAGAVPKPPFISFNPLKIMLASLGIPVEHLIEGSRKCVTELGPEAVGAVKTLLGALTFFG